MSDDVYFDVSDRAISCGQSDGSQFDHCCKMLYRFLVQCVGIVPIYEAEFSMASSITVSEKLGLSCGSLSIILIDPLHSEVSPMSFSKIKLLDEEYTIGAYLSHSALLQMIVIGGIGRRIAVYRIG